LIEETAGIVAQIEDERLGALASSFSGHPRIRRGLFAKLVEADVADFFR
jgi:hypothetical protein